MRIIVALALTVTLARAAAAAGAPAREPAAWPVPPELLTRYEQSGGTETPRHAETIAYCRRLAAASPWLAYTTFGTSPQGRELPLLIADRAGLCTPEQARAAGRAVVLIQACIHAGEPDGKDAGLLLLREIAVAGRLASLLDGVTVLFIPIFNVDGHERFGSHNRINQNGPREMGWRTTARGLNLNRDHVKADAPEMQAWLRLFTAWLPDLMVDCHVTDGADYQYALTYGLELGGNLDAGLAAWARDIWLADLEAELGRRGLAIAPYVMFRKWDDPRSGLRSGVAPPRFSTSYAAAQNRPALLLETHMLKDYRARVEATRAALEVTLRVASREGRRLRALTAAADSLVASPGFRARPLPLTFRAAPDSTVVDFLGVAYDVVTSDLTGGAWIRYDASRPQIWRLPRFDRSEPHVTVDLPAAWVVPPEWDEVIARLALHGVAIRRLARETVLPVTSCRLRDARWEERPFEGRHRLTYEIETFAQERAFPAGAAVIDAGQRTARLIAHALEPAGPDAFVRWGFFDPVFEQKEYAENYVMEAKAREMLAADPALRAELAACQAADPALAASQEAILNWFYLRSPWADPRLEVYPVGRLQDPAAVPASDPVSASAAAPAGANSSAAELRQ